MPDVFVPLDTNTRTHYLNELFYKNVFNAFGFDYVNMHRSSLMAIGMDHFIRDYQLPSDLLKKFVDYAEKNGVKKNEEQLKRSEEAIKITSKQHLLAAFGITMGFIRSTIKTIKHWRKG